MITLQKNKAFVRNLCTEIFSKRNRFSDHLVLTEENSSNVSYYEMRP